MAVKINIFLFFHVSVFTMVYHYHISYANDYVVHQVAVPSMHYSRANYICSVYCDLVLPSTSHMGRYAVEWHYMMRMLPVAIARASQPLLFLRQHRASESIEPLMYHDCLSLYIVFIIYFFTLMHKGRLMAI